MSELIDAIVSHVLDTSPEAFDDHVRRAGRNRVLDAIGCTVSGARVASNEPMAQLLGRWGGAEEASVIGGSARLPVAHAAMLNSLQTRSFDFEVCGPEGEGVNAGKMVGHVGSTTEPTALSVGEYVGATGEEMLAAVILGGDVAARIAVSDNFNFDRAFEVCGTANTFGAVAVAGRLMGLDHRQLRDAFGIALNQMAGSFQSLYDGASSFKLPGAMAAFHGVLACELALQGFDGIKDALESRRGYFAMYPSDPQPGNLLVDLGTVFYVTGQHKLHPSCYGNHNPIECALDVRSQEDFAPDDIESVVLEVQPNRIDHFLNKPFDATSGQAASLFSIPYALGNALVRGVPQLEHYVDANLHDPDVLAVAARSRLAPHSVGANRHANRLVVTLRGGKTLEATREVPVGWLENPMPQEQLDAKFWRNVDFHGGLDRGAAASAFAAIRDLESCPDVTAIARSLAVG